jgi:hypothetical protein
MPKNKTKKIKLIDPPTGWKYGFPKELPAMVHDIDGWLVANGYPQSIIDDFKKKNKDLPYRCWTVEVDE